MEGNIRDPQPGGGACSTLAPFIGRPRTRCSILRRGKGGQRAPDAGRRARNAKNRCAILGTCTDGGAGLRLCGRTGAERHTLQLPTSQPAVFSLLPIPRPSQLQTCSPRSSRSPLEPRRRSLPSRRRSRLLRSPPSPPQRTTLAPTTAPSSTLRSYLERSLTDTFRSGTLGKRCRPRRWLTLSNGFVGWRTQTLLALLLRRCSRALLARAC